MLPDERQLPTASQMKLQDFPPIRQLIHDAIRVLHGYDSGFSSQICMVITIPVKVRSELKFLPKLGLSQMQVQIVIDIHKHINKV